MYVVYLNDNSNLQYYWETDYLKELFHHQSHVIIDKKNPTVFHDIPFIVVNNPLDAMWYLSLYIEASLSFKLILLIHMIFLFMITHYVYMYSEITTTIRLNDLSM